MRPSLFLGLTFWCVWGLMAQNKEYLAATYQYKGESLPYRLLLPENYDIKKKYPLLVDVYGGPGFQKVSDKFERYGWANYVAGSLGIIYAILDPKGSGFQGEDWRFSNDQIWPS